MSTRGCVGFLIDGEEKVTYNHSDSYPSGLGVDVFQFVRDFSTDKLKEIARSIELVDRNSNPTQKQIGHCFSYEIVDLGGGNQFVEDWYWLLHNAQRNLNLYADGLKYMIDSRNFLYDSVFCEYAYIINLDTELLEVYKGFNKDKNAKGRYVEVTDKMRKESGLNKDYYGTKLIATFSLDQIHDQMDEKEFIEAII